MCARVTLTIDDLGEIATALDAEFSPDDARRYRRRYNVAPSDVHWILEYGADRRVLAPAAWGYLPSASSGPSKGPEPPRDGLRRAKPVSARRASKRPVINVRGEQVGSGHGFRHAFESRRCAVVTDGFFEWDARRAPFWYHRADGGLVLLAGLYQDPPPDQHDPRFTVLTTRPNKLVAAVHNRMPVVLPPDHVDEWLTGPPAAAATLIRPAPEHELVVTPVSKRVNSVKNDDAACLAPAGPEPQRELF
jgi:putative SOS response-associated peptidase YedK